MLAAWHILVPDSAASHAETENGGEKKKNQARKGFIFKCIMHFCELTHPFLGISKDRLLKRTLPQPAPNQPEVARVVALVQ